MKVIQKGLGLAISRRLRAVGFALPLLLVLSGSFPATAAVGGVLIFADDFELGNLSLWSDVVGEACGFVHCWLDSDTHCAPSPGCSLASKVCYMGELITTPPQDLCGNQPPVTPFPLAEFADCTAAGLRREDPCGPSSLCVLVAPGDVQCRDLCATSEGALGTTDHPDCRRADAVCLDIGHTDFGLCD